MSALDARASLLAGLIDHAPLFPPASLGLAQALIEDDRARTSDEAWVLGRFVCPASRMAELGAWDRHLSLVLDERPLHDERVEAFETRYGGDLTPFEEMARDVYIELPPDEPLEAILSELAKRALRAKVRCGGTTVPSLERLAAFVRDCREHGVVFKATAGLHHAYPTADGEHGFLNLLAAAVFGDEEEALRAPSGSFELDRDSFRWNGRSATAEQLTHVRQTLFHSIGSCSFFEPIAELRSLGFL